MNLRSVIYNAGWQEDGSWVCPICNTMIGLNLKSEKPFALTAQHVEQHSETDVVRTALNLREKA